MGHGRSTLVVKATDVTISTVVKGEFKDYVRLNGTVVPIQVVQISPEEGGIVCEKVAEEGQAVRKGDVIVRLSNSNLDLQILNAEAELAEKQNLLRNTQVTMQQDRLNNRTEQATLIKSLHVEKWIPDGIAHKLPKTGSWHFMMGGTEGAVVDARLLGEQPLG